MNQRFWLLSLFDRPCAANLLLDDDIHQHSRVALLFSPAHRPHLLYSRRDPRRVDRGGADGGILDRYGQGAVIGEHRHVLCRKRKEQRELVRFEERRNSRKVEAHFFPFHQLAAACGPEGCVSRPVSFFSRRTIAASSLLGCFSLCLYTRRSHRCALFDMQQITAARNSENINILS